MFARPRPKKSVLPPQSKKRKYTHAIEEINFDNDARSDYLTGFHKRKVHRVKQAQEEAAKRAREEKIEIRKQIRDGRKRDVEEHIQNISAILREAERAGGVSDAESSANEGEEWSGLPDTPVEETVDHEEEYIDEDKYTSVTVESVSVSRDGLHKPEQEPPEPDEKELERRAAEAQPAKPKVARAQKKAPKFRYQTKVERQITRKKEKIKKVKGRA